MKKILTVLKIAGIALLPQNAFRSPMRAAVWMSTVVSILWALGALVGIIKVPALPALVMSFWVSLTLIFTVLCEAITESFSREQTASLKTARDGLKAHRLNNLGAAPQTPENWSKTLSGELVSRSKGAENKNTFVDPSSRSDASAGGGISRGSSAHGDESDALTEEIPASSLITGDLVIVRAGEIIPSDGEVVSGIAAVDESALTGESAPVIRESGGDRSAVTAGTKVLSDWVIIKVHAVAGENFLDQMIKMVEGAKRQKTPTEISIEVILTLLTLIFLVLSIAVAALSAAWSHVKGIPSSFGVIETIGLFLCLAPTTIGALLPIVGISGMLRLIKANIIAKSGQAVEAAGNVSMMMLDKTGTITMGDRQAREFYPYNGLSEKEFAAEAQLTSLADTTPEGRSIVVLAKEKFGFRKENYDSEKIKFIEFTAQTKMSGVDLPEKQLRKGAASAIEQWLKNQRLGFPDEIRQRVSQIASMGGTPLVLADNKNGVRGVVALRDVVKGGLKERFAQLRALKIETVMVTGDNPLTAASVAAEAGVDRFIAEATPEQKLKLIREMQAQGHVVAMSGDGTNDAPALAQADVALAMNSGTQPAKEAGNLIDLDSNPTKLIEVVQIGKQNLITTGALTTFSLSNDIAKFFTLLPAMLALLFPSLRILDVIGFSSPAQAMRVALIFNAVIIPLLLPLALIGTPQPKTTDRVLLKHIVIYGLGGAAIPFILMKVIQLIP
jgi:K+-transporting ATPase ATPase B chain